MFKARAPKNDLPDVSKIFESETDPDGMYTGITTTEEYDEPIQDADDL